MAALWGCSPFVFPLFLDSIADESLFLGEKVLKWVFFVRTDCLTRLVGLLLRCQGRRSALGPIGGEGGSLTHLAL